MRIDPCECCGEHIDINSDHLPNCDYRQKPQPAQVTAYSANDWDTSLTLKWECPPCGVEGGWMPDRTGNYIAVQALADKHNKEVHP